MDPLGAHEWLSELVTDDSDLINQWEMKSINNSSVNNHCFNPHSAGSYSGCPSSSAESIQEISQAGMAKSAQNDFSSSYTSALKESQKNIVSTSASSNVISFGNSNSSPKRSMQKCTVKTEAAMISAGEMNFSAEISPSFIFGTVEYGEPTKKVCNRTALQAQDHLLAERKRRERLSERFVALSAMVPDLKKLDKASVLGGAIKYLKQLEERLKILEDEKKRKHDQESINISSVSKRPRLIPYSDETSSSDENSEISLNQQSSPEIEVRISDTNVLVRIYCEKRSGIIKEILGEIEKLHLGIISSSVIPFGSTTLSIAVIAQMDNEDCMRAQELVNTVRMAIQNIMK